MYATAIDQFPPTPPMSSWLPAGRDWLLLALYAAGFALAHGIADAWGGSGYYSLWFPAAGLRLALLWRGGARLTVPAALVELGVDLATGSVRITADSWGHAIVGVVRPVLAYGIVVALVRRLSRRGGGKRAHDRTHAVRLGERARPPRGGARGRAAGVLAA